MADNAHPSSPQATFDTGMTSNATGVDPVKAAFVEAVVAALATGDMPLAVSHSGYGEDGYVEAAVDLDPEDRYQLALSAWYRFARVPEPARHLLIAEAQAWQGHQWGRQARRDLDGADATLAAVLKLRERLRQHGWDADTSNDATFYRGDQGMRARMRPETGQCAVTALIVQDELGGDILRAQMPPGSIRTYSGPQTAGEGGHYFNRLPDGRIVDLTRDQFDAWDPTGPIEVRTREYLLSSESTASRYELLRARVSKGRHTPERLRPASEPARMPTSPTRGRGRLGPSRY